MKTGLEVFLGSYLDRVRDRKVGLVTNSSAVDRGFRPVLDIFFEHPEIDLVALYGPEHGVRGHAQAGEYVPFYVDDKYNLPVYSLYGQTMKPPDVQQVDIDEIMRTFDTRETDKSPDPEMLAGVDVMIFDIQDVGTRIFTYVATMGYCLRVCGEIGIEFIILDRPNPINGVMMEGPVLQYPEYSSFVGLYPVPIRHGMTLGELASMYHKEFLKEKAGLRVIPLEGWRRRMWHDETGLPWAMPSPNLPTLKSATVYPGQVLLEGTNVSEGRGTTRPFEVFGAPWIEGHELTRRLNSLDLPGIRFQEAWFTPAFSKFLGELCGGCVLHVLDRSLYRPVTVSLTVIDLIRRLYPQHFRFHSHYFDRIMGTPVVRESWEKDVSLDAIAAGFDEQIENFAQKREPYLLYE